MAALLPVRFALLPLAAQKGNAEARRPSVRDATSPQAFASKLNLNRRDNTATVSSFKFQVFCSSKGFGPRRTPPPPKKATPIQPNTPAGTIPFKKPDSDVANMFEKGDDDIIPEVVTNRILKRLAVTVGMPLGAGLCFFPIFYYLKVIMKVDVPEWLPLISSTLLFGMAGFGISYGVISTSWDPEREGTFWGWKEARANWPVFTQTLSKDRK